MTMIVGTFEVFVLSQADLKKIHDAAILQSAAAHNPFIKYNFTPHTRRQYETYYCCSCHRKPC